MIEVQGLVWIAFAAKALPWLIGVFLIWWLFFSETIEERVWREELERNETEDERALREWEERTGSGSLAQSPSHPHAS